MKLSIITINYNNVRGLEDTMKSILGQDSSAFEYIVVDGGSTDGSKEVIEKYKQGVSYWVSEKDRGIYHAMNKGVAVARGEYCLFINSGDCLYDNHVVSKFNTSCYKEDIIVGKVFANTDMLELSLPPSRELSMYFLYSGAIPHQGAFIKTELLRQIPYDENLKIVSDWKFFVQTIILQNVPFRYIDDRVAIYDTSGLSFSNPTLMRLEKEQYLEEILPPRILYDYSWMKSSECLMQTLTPQLRVNYRIDKFLCHIGTFLLKLFGHKS